MYIENQSLMRAGVCGVDVGVLEDELGSKDWLDMYNM